MTRTHTVPAGTMASAFANAGIAAPVIPTSLTEAAELNKSLPIAQQWVNYNGEFMSRLEMQALADEADEERACTPVVTGIEYFDPQQLIEDKLTNQTAIAVLRSSMSWITGARVIGTARNIFFHMHQSAIEAGTTMGGIDAYAEFTNAIRESWADGEALEDMGLTPDTGNMEALRKMIGLHRNWSMQALQSNIMAGLRYEEPNLDEMTSSPMPIDALAQEKELTVIRLEAEIDGLTPEQLEADIKVAKEKFVRDYKANAERTKTIAPAVMAIYTAASTSMQETEFWQLNVEVRAQMIEALRRSTLKAVQTLGKMRAVTVSEYVKAARELKALHAELGNVLVAYAARAAH